MAASNRKLGAFFLLRLNDHVQYMNKIKATLAGTGTFRGCDHHSCKLGRWIDGDGRKQAEALGPEILALFDSLHAPHVAYHAASKAALDLLAEGDTEGSARASGQMVQLSVQIIARLLEMDKRSGGA